MESTPYTIINVCNLNATEKQSVVDFDIFYEEKFFYNSSVSSCVVALNEWHQKYYKSVCPYIIQDDETIDYTNQYINFKFVVSEKTFILNTYAVEGYNVRASVEKMSFIVDPKKNEDYVNLVKLIKKISEEVIKENYELNKEYDEEQQKLCDIEYSMDHC
jgi:hypothetical protein